MSENVPQYYQIVFFHFESFLFQINKKLNLILNKRYYIKSGNPEHPDDRLYNATFHILPENKLDDSKLPKEYQKLTDGYYNIDKFSNELGIVSGVIDPIITGKLSKIRIHIPQSSETWIIVSEIDFSTKPDDSRKSLMSLIKSSSVYLNFSTPRKN